jgi:MFS family permease
VQSYIRDYRRYHRDVKLFLVYSLFANIGIGVFTLLFNLYLTELGHREDYIGRWNSVNTLTMGFVALVMGFLINRYGVWKCVFGGLLLFLSTSFVLCLVTDPLLLLIFAGLAGAGTAFLFVPTMPFIVELTGARERHGVAALAFSLQSLATMFGSLLGGWMPKALALVGLHGGSAETYRYTLIVGTAVAGLALAPLLAMTAHRRNALPGESETSEPDLPERERPRRNIRRDMLVFIAVGGLMSLGAGAVFPFYNVFLETRGASAGDIGLIYSAAGLMAALCGLLSPYVARRFGSLRAVMLVRLAPVPFYLLLIGTPMLPIAIFCHMIRTTSINMAWPIDSTYISENLPAKARSQVFSFRSGAWNFGWALSSLLAGQAIVDYGYSVSFAAYILFMTAAMLLYYVYFTGAARASARVPLADASAPATANT